MIKPAPHKLEAMLSCSRRELAMRKAAYPKWVASGRMKEHEAEREIRVMGEVVELVLAVIGEPADG